MVAWDDCDVDKHVLSRRSSESTNDLPCLAIETDVTRVLEPAYLKARSDAKDADTARSCSPTSCSGLAQEGAEDSPCGIVPIF